VTPATTVEPSLILIVEDDEDSREVYKEILETHGFEVETATSGSEGLRLARELHPGAILMDISIPDMDGWAVTSRLKADPDTSDIPVIVVTAYAFPEDRTRADSMGCDGFLTKPCEPSRVLAEIQRLLGTPGSP
jgi:CheY-like chemotaxis protein